MPPFFKLKKMETNTHTQEQTILEQQPINPDQIKTPATPEIDLFDLMHMAKKIDRVLGEQPFYTPWDSKF
jgi:hypothetical protein